MTDKHEHDCDCTDLHDHDCDCDHDHEFEDDNIVILIDEEGHGLFFPQNERYVDTLELVKLVAKVHGNKLCLTPVPNWCMTIGLELWTSFRKVFGSLTYDRAMVMSCDTVSFEDSILQTERP